MSSKNLGTPSSGKARSSKALSESCAYNHKSIEAYRDYIRVKKYEIQEKHKDLFLGKKTWISTIRDEEVYFLASASS